MLVFGFGISTDVNNLTFAVLDHDHSHESRAYLEELRGSSYFVEKPPLADYADLEKRLQSGSIDAAVRDSARLRPRHRTRTAGLGRRLGGRRDAVPRRDHPRLSAGHASALSDRSGREDDGAASPSACRYRDPVQIQSGFRQHLRHGSGESVAAAGAVPGDPHGARHRARKGAWLDHQSLCDSGHPARISARQANSLYRRRHGEFFADVPDGACSSSRCRSRAASSRCCSAR